MMKDSYSMSHTVPGKGLLSQFLSFSILDLSFLPILTEADLRQCHP